MMRHCTLAILLAAYVEVVEATANRGERGGRELSSDDFARGAAIRPYPLPWWHPEIQHVAVNRIPGPSNHPLLDNDPEFQAFVRANTDEGHRFLDGRRGYIQRPWRLPRGHPNCDNYFIYEELPVDDLPTVHFDHPDVHEAYLNGQPLPPGHPSASNLLAKVLPEGHPDVDDLFLGQTVELPEWHPDLSLLLNDNPIDPIYVFSGHPDINDDLGEPIDDHPSVHHLFEAHLPLDHPDIDELMLEGFTLPSWHPDISKMVIPRSSVTSPGSLLCLIVAALLVVIVLVRSMIKWKNSRRTMEIVVADTDGKDSSERTGGDNSSLSESKDGSVEIMMRRDPLDAPGPSYNSNEERILVYREKKTSWKRVFGRRVGKGSRSMAEVMLCLCYLVVNIVALWLSRDYSLGLGFGSLSAGNTLFVFATAARNSVFSWFVGVTFDQVLVYHRFFGRLTVLLALIHSCFYIDDIVERTSDSVIVTGLVALGCGLVIVLSSVNYVRRKYFNMFFWTHYSFLGFMVGLFLHATAARPFVIASVGCYCVDKGLQAVRKIPRSTTVFEKVDERTVRVQFAKTFLTSFQEYKAGQYMFVNFPALSLQEWHVSMRGFLLIWCLPLG
jgi:hypothetical protein